MRVALTQRTATDPRTGEVRDCLDQRWAPLLESWDMLPVPLPTALAAPERLLEELRPDALVLTGGNDLSALPDARTASAGRDAFEERVVAWCRERGVLVVGICRGMQLLAHLAGASLLELAGHIGTRHPIRVDFGESGPEVVETVNSYHRYAVAPVRLPPELVPFAWDDGGHVEAFRGRAHREVGLMWHPEREPEPSAWGRAVFRELLEDAV